MLGISIAHQRCQSIGELVKVALQLLVVLNLLFVSIDQLTVLGQCFAASTKKNVKLDNDLAIVHA